MERQYTCIPDFNYSDTSRFDLASYHTGGATDAPSEYCIDTKPWRVHDQEGEKSCVGYATSSVREHYARIKRLNVELSPLFIYWFARSMDAMTFQDGGCRIINALTSLGTYGVCEEQYHKSVWGTNDDVFVAPNTAAMVSARSFLVAGFTCVPNIISIKECLSHDNPVVAGIPVYESLETKDVNWSGIVPVPGPGEKLLGGHAIALVGYDDKTQRVKFQNSWGTGWGDKGYGYIPYEFLRTQHFDAWEIRC